MTDLDDMPLILSERGVGFNYSLCCAFCSFLIRFLSRTNNINYTNKNSDHIRCL